MSARSLLALAASVGLCLGVAFAGSAVTTPSIDTWYEGIAKPPWTPPDWVFPVVWTTLFIMMGVAAWLVWLRVGFSEGRLALSVFALQLALNFTWSLLFFGLQRPGAALLEIVPLWGAILATLVLFWRIRPAAGLLLVPYLAWVGFAVFLNFGIWQLNS